MSERESGQTVLGENTFIRLGMVVGFLMTFGWAVWWASGVQSDLTTIKSQMIRFGAVDNLDSRVKLLEAVGSPALRDMQKQLDDLKREFELHRVDSIKKQ